MTYPNIIYTVHFCFKCYTLLSDSEHRTIWQMRNAPEIRMYMDNPEPFPFENHQKFVSSLTDRSARAYYGVYEIGGGKLIGNQSVINIGKNLEAESGQYIFPTEQGHGYGTLMKYEFINYLFSEGLLQRVVEKVKIFNERNKYLNQKLGFRLYDSDSEYNYYEVTPSTLLAP